MSYDLNLKERGIEFIELSPEECPALPNGQQDSLEFFDLCYRSLCSVMFNHASSGHPGGSVSSGRIVQSLVFNRMDYSISDPMDRTADILSYSAGHKALGRLDRVRRYDEFQQLLVEAVLDQAGEELPFERPTDFQAHDPVNLGIAGFAIGLTTVNSTIKRISTPVLGLVSARQKPSPQEFWQTSSVVQDEPTSGWLGSGSLPPPPTSRIVPGFRRRTC